MNLKSNKFSISYPNVILEHFYARNLTNNSCLIKIAKKLFYRQFYRQFYRENVSYPFNAISYLDVKNAFEKYDKKSDGNIKPEYLCKVLRKVGLNPTENQVDTFLNEILVDGKSPSADQLEGLNH